MVCMLTERLKMFTANWLIVCLSIRTMQMEVSFPVYDKKDKTSNYRTIDGLCFLSDDVVGKFMLVFISSMPL